MTNTDFLNSDSTKNLILFNLYDVDEFILRVVEDIKRNNLLEQFDVSKAKRYSYEIFRIGENECEEYEISTDEYLVRIEHNEGLCFTKLNYEDFEKELTPDFIESLYDDNWLYEFQYNKAFFQEANKWIENTSGDVSKELRLRDLLNRLKSSYKSLDSIKSDLDNNILLHPIQKTVIKIFKRFDNVMIEGLTNRYKSFFSKLFTTIDNKPSNQIIIDKLIDGQSNKIAFENYEKKLVNQEYLSEDRKQWLKKSSDLVRLYNFFERKKIINRAYKDNSKGIKLLRELYNFHEGKSIDSPRSKRLKQDESKKNIDQFIFLDII